MLVFKPFFQLNRGVPQDQPPHVFAQNNTHTHSKPIFSNHLLVFLYLCIYTTVLFKSLYSSLIYSCIGTSVSIF